MCVSFELMRENKSCTSTYVFLHVQRKVDFGWIDHSIIRELSKWVLGFNFRLERLKFTLQRLVICPWQKDNIFNHSWQYCLVYFFVYSKFCRHPTTLESGEVLWGLMKTQNKLEGINPVINIIEHNWLYDHQGNAYMWLDWLHRCHLIIKRLHLELVNVLRLFHFELSEFSAMKRPIFSCLSLPSDQ